MTQYYGEGDWFKAIEVAFTARCRADRSHLPQDEYKAVKAQISTIRESAVRRAAAQQLKKDFSELKKASEAQNYSKASGLARRAVDHAGKFRNKDTQYFKAVTAYAAKQVELSQRDQKAVDNYQSQIDDLTRDYRFKANMCFVPAILAKGLAATLMVDAVAKFRVNSSQLDWRQLAVAGLIYLGSEIIGYYRKAEQEARFAAGLSILEKKVQEK